MEDKAWIHLRSNVSCEALYLDGELKMMDDTISGADIMELAQDAGASSFELTTDYVIRELVGDWPHGAFPDRITRDNVGEYNGS